MADIMLKVVLACLVSEGTISLAKAEAIFRGGDAFAGATPVEIRAMTLEDMVDHIKKWEV